MRSRIRTHEIAPTCFNFFLLERVRIDIKVCVRKILMRTPYSMNQYPIDVLWLTEPFSRRFSGCGYADTYIIFLYGRQENTHRFLTCLIFTGHKIPMRVRIRKRGIGRRYVLKSS